MKTSQPVSKHQVIDISSSQNETFKYFKNLTTAKGIKKDRQFLIPSQTICSEFINSYLQPQSALKKQFKLISILRAKNSELDEKTSNDFGSIENLKYYIIDSNLFKEIDILGTNSYLLHVEYAPLTKINSAIELHQLFKTNALFESNPNSHFLSLSSGDPKNLGALVRSARAFQAQAVFLTQEASHPFLQQSIKSSAGAVFYVSIAQTVKLNELIAFFSDLGLNLYSLDLQGESIVEAKLKKPCLLILGEEGGYSKDFPFHLTNRVFIPTHGVESLNVSVAGSLALYELSRKIF